MLAAGPLRDNFPPVIVSTLEVLAQGSQRLLRRSEYDTLVPLGCFGPYTQDHPSQAFLDVEVSASSLRRDRFKAELHAASGFQEYWLVDGAWGRRPPDRSPNTHLPKSPLPCGSSS